MDGADCLAFFSPFFLGGVFSGGCVCVCVCFLCMPNGVGVSNSKEIQVFGHGRGTEQCSINFFALVQE